MLMISKRGFTPLEICAALKRRVGSILRFSFMSSRSPRSASLTGFTIIELLVVIAIIGVLASIVLTSLASARARARDARRISDLKQMLTAIAQLGDAQLTFEGCTSSGVRAATCTPTPNLSVLADPSSATVCPNPIVLGTPCDYRVVRRMAAGNPAANDYQICANLEQGSNTLTAGAVRIGDNTGNGIQQGDCAR